MGYGYYNYYPKAAARPKPKPGKNRKKFGETWWGAQWVEVISTAGDEQRMSRGRAYARAEMVKNFKIMGGKISAKVQGNSGVYSITISFTKHKERDWQNIIEKLKSTPIVLGTLLNNEMPENLAEITGCSFIPKEFDADCSCPDYANPCKHIAAVFYMLADEIDHDPFLLLELCGMKKDKLLELVSGTEKKKTKRKKTPKRKIRKRGKHE